MIEHFHETPVGKGLLKEHCGPLTRFGDPPEFGHMVVAMVENPYLNAETVRLDAGCRMPKL